MTQLKFPVQTSDLKKSKWCLIIRIWHNDDDTDTDNDDFDDIVDNYDGSDDDDDYDDDYCHIHHVRDRVTNRKRLS